jgi:guanine deaminase
MQSDQAQKFMQEAIQLSLEGSQSGKGGPFGAVVVKDDRIIGRGCNQVITNNDPTAHAEIVAIRDACHTLQSFHLDGCIIYTSCEPCPMCLAAIYWAKIEKIVFANTRNDAASIGFNDAFIYDEVSLPLHKRQIQTEQLLSNEAAEVFKKWFNKGDRKLY